MTRPFTMTAEREAQIRAAAFPPDGRSDSHRMMLCDAMAELSATRACADKLEAALREFMDIWGSRDSSSTSKRAQARRAAMWDKAKAALAERPAAKESK